MSIKTDKTFEEIVERLVALFRGQHEDDVIDAPAQRSSVTSPEQTPSHRHLPAPAEDDAAS